MEKLFLNQFTRDQVKLCIVFERFCLIFVGLSYFEKRSYIFQYMQDDIFSLLHFNFLLLMDIFLDRLSSTQQNNTLLSKLRYKIRKSTNKKISDKKLSFT